MPAISYQHLAHIPGLHAGRTIIEDTRIGVHAVVSLIVPAQPGPR